MSAFNGSLSIAPIMREAEVLPVPLGPANNKAWGIFPNAIILSKEVLTELMLRSEIFLGR